jgi:7-dehydrocholesterol reductase
MEPIVLTSSTHCDTNKINQLQDKANESIRQPLYSLSSTHIPWGRRHNHGSSLHNLGCACIMIFCPLLVLFYWISLSLFHGSLTAAWHAMWTMGPMRFYWLHTPRGEFNVHLCYIGWLLFQAGLYQLLPGRSSVGQLTPAGNLLKYRTNGLLAWVLTHIGFVACVITGNVDPAIIARNWAPLLVSANMYGFLLSGFAYIKAHVSASHVGDRKFSGKATSHYYLTQADKLIGSVMYDLYMGIELNPRLGKSFDLKLFHNGRPSIIAWTLM